MSGIYVASKTKHAPTWRQLRDFGFPICSTWIDEAAQGQTKSWPDLWSRCVREAACSDALVLYHETGEVLKGALVEVGVALGEGIPVFWVGPRMSVCSHRCVKQVWDEGTKSLWGATREAFREHAYCRRKYARDATVDELDALVAFDLKLRGKACPGDDVARGQMEAG